MIRPAVIALLAAAVTGLAAAPAAAETASAETGTHGAYCVQLTFADGTSSPKICVPHP